MGANWDAVMDVRNSRVTALGVIVSASVLDHVLLTIVVPILPLVFIGECSPSDNGGNESTLPGSNTTGFAECERQVNTELGLLMGSQFIVRFAMSFFGSFLSNRCGYYWLIFTGCMFMIASSLVYAFAQSYAVYFLGRILHGFGALPSQIGGIGLIAYRFRENDEKRGMALGFVICGFAVGTLVGPILGAVLNHFLGKTAPFLFLAGAWGLVALAEMAIFQHEDSDGPKEDIMAIVKILRDPLILIPAGVLTIASIVIGLIEPALPVWMISTMDAEDWELGVVFLPAGCASAFGTLLFGYLSYKIGRWLCMILSLVVMAIAVATLPFARNFNDLIPPMMLLGLCFGTIDSTTCATFNYLVQKRHQGAYGGAATLSVITFSFGLVAGPALSSALVNYIGFPWMLRALGILCLVYAPFCLYLRNMDSLSSSNEEEMSLVASANKAPVKPVQTD